MHAYAPQSRHGGRWRKEELAEETAAPGGPTHFVNVGDVQKQPSPDKRLFSGAPSNTFSVEAHSAL